MGQCVIGRWRSRSLSQHAASTRRWILQNAGRPTTGNPFLDLRSPIAYEAKVAKITVLRKSQDPSSRRPVGPVQKLLRASPNAQDRGGRINTTTTSPDSEEYELVEYPDADARKTQSHREERRKKKRAEKRRWLEEQDEMKFSHSLQFNAVPDWSSHYIAYSNLKKLYENNPIVYGLR